MTREREDKIKKIARHYGYEAQSRRQDIIFFCPKCKVVGNVFDNPELLN